MHSQRVVLSYSMRDRAGGVIGYNGPEVEQPSTTSSMGAIFSPITELTMWINFFSWEMFLLVLHQHTAA